MSAQRVVIVACVATMLVSCSNGDQDEASGLPRFSPPPSAAARTDASPAPSDTERIVEAYQAYTAAVTQALAEGDAAVRALRTSATGDALDDVRTRVRANREDGVLTAGELEPSATTAQVDWPGGDTATISDCVLNGLAHVDADRPGRVIAEADGTRRPVRAELSRTSDGWIVSSVEMPADEHTDVPKPFLRGPMPDGPPSCAPPELEQELLTRYQAFWDAFDRAFGFGRDGPANPDDPALAETQVDPQLSRSREFFEQLRSENRTSRGERDSRDPWVVGVTDFDKTAFVADCVTLGDSQTIDLDTGRVVERNPAGRLDYEETQLVRENNRWMVTRWNTRVEGQRSCEAPS